jgi:hypothetical protein
VLGAAAAEDDGDADALAVACAVVGGHPLTVPAEVYPFGA